MATVRFSVRAKADLLGIARYTLQTWGEAQARRYLDAMEKCAKMLAAKPTVGRPCEWICAGLHRFENGKHVLFYRLRPSGIFVARILHVSMLPDRHSFEGSDRES
jgi:toxin ParE1/3/4